MTIRSLMSKILLPVFLIQSGLTSVAAAQEFAPEPDWKISAYLWTAALDGTLGLGPIEADIDLSFSDLLSDLDIGGSLAVRRDMGSHMLVGDLTYLALTPDDQPGPMGSTIGSGLDLTLLAAYYGYKWGQSDRYGALLVGARYNELAIDMNVKFDLPTAPEVKVSVAPSFTDIVIGGMFATKLSPKWDMFFTGDIGAGGSNSSWQTQVMFQRRLQSGNRINMGARILSVDFDDTVAGGQLFVLDATITGFMFGFTWD
jgi:hypothetical protein